MRGLAIGRVTRLLAKLTLSRSPARPVRRGGRRLSEFVQRSRAKGDGAVRKSNTIGLGLACVPLLKAL
jgi:hypothetical protein